EDKEKAEQVELESSKKVRGSRRKTLSRKRAGEKKSADSVKRQKLQEAEVYEKEKEEFRLRRMEAKDIAVYKVTRAYGSASYHGDIQAFLRRLDRQDLEVVYRLAQEKFQDHHFECHDLMLWGDLRMIFDSNKEDELEAEEESTMALELIKFIKSLLEE
ncbi:hypothetical protein Tco_1557586, partial [Tanacetum coccineum]